MLALPMFHRNVKACSSVALSGCLLNCAPPPASPPGLLPAPPAVATPGPSASDKEAQHGPHLPWARSIYSPRPGSTPEPALVSVEQVCGNGDAALHEAATFVAQLHAKEGEAPSLERVRFHMQRSGAPYVSPRLWSATMNQLDERAVADQVQIWARSRPSQGEQRCGVGLHVPEQGAIVVSVISVDVLADVAPLPTQVQLDTRLDLRATLLRPSTAASVVVLPPHGMPHSVETHLKGAAVEARLYIDGPGTWLIQLMATNTGGPQPVAQTLLTAEAPLPKEPNDQPVPGESRFSAQLSPADALFAMLNGAREEEGLPLLRRSDRLDGVARQHSLAMRDRNAISHDTGRGDPARRVEAAGMHPKAVGENVARARSSVHLHRVLWASPSHRENLLLRRWDEVGISVLEDRSGQWVATQLFADED